MNYSDQVKTLLLEEFTRSRARNPRFSMRAFASRIDVAQSVLSELLNGNRPLTKKTARRILQGLSRDPQEISRILESSGENQIAYTQLDMDQFHLISDWYYYAILSLCATEGFRATPDRVASRLGISPLIAKQALTRLERLKLLARKGTQLIPVGPAFAAISPVAHLALRKANQQNIALAEKALSEVPVEVRDFTAITLCFDPDRIEDARRMIKSFRRNFDRVMESGRKREVYKLCIQLFPLSQQVSKVGKS